MEKMLHLDRSKRRSIGMVACTYGLELASEVVPSLYSASKTRPQ